MYYIYEILGKETRLESKGELDAALNLIYDQVDEMLKAEHFEQVDSLLRNVNIENLSMDLLLAFLTVTFPARSKLPSRAEFFSKVKEVLERREEWTEGLLTGLES